MRLKWVVADSAGFHLFSLLFWVLVGEGACVIESHERGENLCLFLLISIVVCFQIAQTDLLVLESVRVCCCWF